MSNRVEPEAMGWLRKGAGAPVAEAVESPVEPAKPSLPNPEYLHIRHATYSHTGTDPYTGEVIDKTLWYVHTRSSAISTALARKVAPQLQAWCDELNSAGPASAEERRYAIVPTTIATLCSRCQSDRDGHEWEAYETFGGFPWVVGWGEHSSTGAPLCHHHSAGEAPLLTALLERVSGHRRSPRPPPVVKVESAEERVAREDRARMHNAVALLAEAIAGHAPFPDDARRAAFALEGIALAFGLDFKGVRPSAVVPKDDWPATRR